MKPSSTDKLQRMQPSVHYKSSRKLHPYLRGHVDLWLMANTCTALTGRSRQERNNVASRGLTDHLKRLLPAQLQKAREAPANAIFGALFKETLFRCPQLRQQR